MAKISFLDKNNCPEKPSLLSWSYLRTPALTLATCLLLGVTGLRLPSRCKLSTTPHRLACHEFYIIKTYVGGGEKETTNHHPLKNELEMIYIIFLIIITITTTSSSATLAPNLGREVRISPPPGGAHHHHHDYHPHHYNRHHHHHKHHHHHYNHHHHHYKHHHFLICHLSSQSGKGGGKISSTRQGSLKVPKMVFL